MSRYLQVNIGNSLNHEFVDESYWKRCKEFASLPPAEVQIHDQSIVYSVPPSQVAFGDPQLNYELWCDFGCQTVVCKTEQILYQEIIPSVGILREINLDEKAVFRLIESCQFSDIRVVSRDVHYKFLLDSHEFEMVFQESWRCPLRGNDYWRFVSPPRFEIYVLSRTASKFLIQEFCSLALPK